MPRWPAAGSVLANTSVHVGDAGVGDPHLRAREDVVVAVAHGPGRHRRHVRAGVGLRQAVRRLALARGDPRDVLLLQLLGAEVDAPAACRASRSGTSGWPRRRPGPAPRRRWPASRDRRRSRRTRPAAARPVSSIDCSALNVSHEYSAALVVAGGQWRDLVLAELPQHPPELVLLLGERDGLHGQESAALPGLPWPPMRSLLARRLRLVLLAGATVLLLTGCVKLDVDLTVGDNDTVSGTYIIAIDRSLLQLTGQDADSLYEQLSSGFDTSKLPAGATADDREVRPGQLRGRQDHGRRTCPSPSSTTSAATRRRPARASSPSPTTATCTTSTPSSTPSSASSGDVARSPCPSRSRPAPSSGSR